MILLIVLLALAAVLLLASAGAFLFVFHSPNRWQNDDFHLSHIPQIDPFRAEITDRITRLKAIPFERVSIRSRDGLRLAGRYYPGREGAPIVLAFHGYRGTPARDFAGGTQFYLSEGYGLLMAEQRAHGASEGHVIAFGVKERYDCLDWISYVRERFGPDRPLLLAGISMGAATVLMASGLDLPPNVRAVLADAPFTSPAAILRKVCADLHVPPALAMPLLRLGARLFGGFGLDDADAAEAVQSARVPILVIHGEDDRFVPCDMGRAVAAANPDLVRLETFPGAGHGLSFLVDRPRYERVVRAFFARALGE